jgi:bacterioferritin
VKYEEGRNHDEREEGQLRPDAVADLIDALNEDLSREYQAIIAYTVYSSVLTGAQWMNIAAELKLHAGQELQHALIIADQIDYLGGTPTATAKPVKLSKKAEEMLRFDLDNETETIKNYRQRWSRPHWRQPFNPDQGPTLLQVLGRMHKG